MENPAHSSPEPKPKHDENQEPLTEKHILNSEECERKFGIKAPLVKAFEIGEQKFGIFQIPPNQTSCYPKNHDLWVTTPFIIHQFSEDLEIDIERYKGLREGEEVTIGRQSRHRFQLDPTVSRLHVLISLHDGLISIKDLRSTNGTIVYTDTRFLTHHRLDQKKEEKGGYSRRMVMEAMPNQDNKEHATEVKPHEITRQPDNDGNPLNHDYIKNNKEVREYLVRLFLSGKLYDAQSEQPLIDALCATHIIACKRNVYTQVGQGAMSVNPGETRSEYLVNSRLRQSEEIAELAKRYHDPYADRFSNNTRVPSRVRLEGIPEDYLPVDFFNSNGKYQFAYPPPESIPIYFKKINELGHKIQQKMKSSDYTTVLELIALQYQYCAIIRPFYQVNNSLFMNLSNMQIKLLGLNGISHYDLDLAAQRMQSNTFVRYFLDVVKQHNNSS